MPYKTILGSGMEPREVLDLAISRVEKLGTYRLDMARWDTCAWRAVIMTTPEVAGIGLGLSGGLHCWPVAVNEPKLDIGIEPRQPIGIAALAICFNISEHTATKIFVGPPYNPEVMSAADWARHARNVLSREEDHIKEREPA